MTPQKAEVGAAVEDVIFPDAQREARMLKLRFPEVRIALHHNNNAKVVLVAPDTVWVSSADFGKTARIKSAVGLHSNIVFKRTRESFFDRV
ncbi:hypothetical protein [Variovorax sp. YR266]|uniref:hypothetical protein n=1 Tax=Variovorax sp. YR266 TaxID=1884386 RepID=UPI00115F8C1E|nr:hypothetical protein [Variovorax sp. YR266]